MTLTALWICLSVTGGVLLLYFLINCVRIYKNCFETVKSKGKISFKISVDELRWHKFFLIIIPLVLFITITLPVIFLLIEYIHPALGSTVFLTVIVGIFIFAILSNVICLIIIFTSGKDMRKFGSIVLTFFIYVIAFASPFLLVTIIVFANGKKAAKIEKAEREKNKCRSTHGKAKGCAAVVAVK